MRTNRATTPVSFDGLGRRQLLVYAHEMGESFRQLRSLRDTLGERERHIRGLAAATIAAQEDERQWIACEVHDRIAQTLASVFQQLQVLESLTRDDHAARQVAMRASVLLREAIRESRNIMNDLHPPILDEFGIDPLIREELGHLEKDRGCETTYESSYAVRPPQDVEVALYRIFHEALINTMRHAVGAKKVAVSLVSGAGDVTLAVQDDGPGFDVEAALQAKRVGGLTSMRRRADIIGGHLRVESSSGRGTTVRVSVPLNGHSRRCKA